MSAHPLDTEDWIHIQNMKGYKESNNTICGYQLPEIHKKKIQIDCRIIGYEWCDK